MEPKKYKQILDIGLSLDAFQALVYLVEGTDYSLLMQYTKFENLLVLLERKEMTVFMTSQGKYEVTDAGMALYKKAAAPPAKGLTKEALSRTLPQSDVQVILSSMKEKLQQLRGVTQIDAFGHIPFIPSLLDLQQKLKVFKEKYPNLFDLKKIEKCLVDHIVNCHKRDRFTPAIKYFIHKEDAGSSLAAYLEALEDKNSEVSQYGIVDSKDLFE